MEEIIKLTNYDLFNEELVDEIRKHQKVVVLSCGILPNTVGVASHKGEFTSYIVDQKNSSGPNMRVRYSERPMDFEDALAKARHDFNALDTERYKTSPNKEYHYNLFNDGLYDTGKINYLKKHNLLSKLGIYPLKYSVGIIFEDGKYVLYGIGSNLSIYKKEGIPDFDQVLSEAQGFYSEISKIKSGKQHTL